MKQLALTLLGLFTGALAMAQTSLVYTPPVKQRIFVLTDITNEPDDQQSLVRFLAYANEYDISIWTKLHSPILVIREIDE